MKSTFQFLAILLVGLLVIGAQSLPEKVTPLDTTMRDTIPPIMKKDTSAQKILLFGDSMVAPLSYRVRDYATRNGHTLTTVCWYSSSTKTWAASDTLEYFLRKYTPTHVFICLGSNQLFVRNLDEIDKHIKTIKGKLGDIPAIWIGPPNWKPDTGINDLLLKNMGPHAYYPSKDLTFERISDGAHPTEKSAEAWFDSVAVWINNGHAIHPINLELPTEEGKQRMIILQPEN